MKTDPDFSVVIPNFNGARFLDALVGALATQTLDRRRYEILFVDNGSTDDSLVRMRSAVEKIPNLQVFSYTDHASSYAARNFGVAQAKGRYLVFTDSDCRPTPQWLAEIAAFADQTGAPFLLTGPVQMVPAGNPPNIYEFYDSVAINQQRYAARQEGATANLAVSKDVFERLGGFAVVKSGGDIDFCRRVHEKQLAPFTLLQSALVLHPARSTFREIAEKARRTNEGGVALIGACGLSGTKLLIVLAREFFKAIVQPAQCRRIIAEFKATGLLKRRSWKLASIIWIFGLYGRVFRIKRIFKDRR